MKPSHRKDVIIARIIFGIICIAIVAIIAAIVVVVSSHSKKNKEIINTETQTEAPTETEEVPVFVPNDTEIIEQDIFYKTTTGVNMRQEPSTEANVVTVLPEGVELKFISEDNGWGQVEYEGQTGYVSMEFIAPAEPVDDTEADTNSDSEETSESDSNTTGSVNNNHIVVLDPGHQAEGESKTEPNGPGSSTMKARVTGGTRGTTTGVYEYELVLDIGLQLKEELEARGYTVYMTRTSHDVKISNKERAEYASSVGGDISVRLHANGDNSSSASGALTLAPSASNAYVSNLASDSQNLSKCIIDEYCAATGMKNRGVLTNDTMTGINWSTIPVTIIELGYMTNQTDDKNMEDGAFQQKMVDGIADGIDKYFGL